MSADKKERSGSKKSVEIDNLETMLDVIGAATTGRNELSIGVLMDRIGHRSFAPLLLFAGLVTMAPIVGDVPGVPTVMGVCIFLVAAQMLLRRKYIWLPQFIERRSVRAKTVTKTIDRLRRPARAVDTVLRPRFTALTTGVGAVMIAGSCMLIALAMPLMEVVLFAANIAGIAVTAFGLALIARDGLVATFAFLFTAVTFGSLLWFFV